MSFEQLEGLLTDAAFAALQMHIPPIQSGQKKRKVEAVNAVVGIDTMQSELQKVPIDADTVEFIQGLTQLSSDSLDAMRTIFTESAVQNILFLFPRFRPAADALQDHLKLSFLTGIAAHVRINDTDPADIHFQLRLYKTNGDEWTFNDVIDVKSLIARNCALQAMNSLLLHNTWRDILLSRDTPPSSTISNGVASAPASAQHSGRVRVPDVVVGAAQQHQAIPPIKSNAKNVKPGLSIAVVVSICLACVVLIVVGIVFAVKYSKSKNTRAAQIYSNFELN